MQSNSNIFIKVYETYVTRGNSQAKSVAHSHFTNKRWTKLIEFKTLNLVIMIRKDEVHILQCWVFTMLRKYIKFQYSMSTEPTH